MLLLISSREIKDYADWVKAFRFDNCELVMKLQHFWQSSEDRRLDFVNNKGENYFSFYTRMISQFELYI